MKILQVFGSLQRGGAETMFMNLYRGLDHEKYKIDFLVKERTDNGYEDEVLRNGDHIILVESPKKSGLLKYIVALKKCMIEKGPYDIIHSHMNDLSGLILFTAKIVKIPIRISHSHSASSANSYLKFTMGKLLVKCFANKRVACGKKAGSFLFGRSKFVVLPNAIEPSKYVMESNDERNKLRMNLNFSDDSIYLVHIGRFVEAKNHMFLLDIFSSLIHEDNRFKLLLLGDGPLLESVKDKAFKLSISKNIVFLGSVSNPWDYLKASDIFILPSLWEGLPVSVIEAQCSGVPCLISDVVTKDSDMRLGLVTFLPLDRTLWVKGIVSALQNRRLIVKDIILEKLAEQYYDVNKSRTLLLSIYK